MAVCCPKTFAGFCLNDNTPIAITLDNGVIVSWTNLVTGIVTPGNPPVGTGICEVPSVVTVEIEPLTCVKDSVTACQGTNPWEVTGTLVVDPPNLDCLTDSVTVCQGTDPWTVDGTVALDAATLAALETVTVNQGTSPWIVSGTVSVTEPVTVDAVDFDIRNLACGQDSVDACVTFDYPEDSLHVSGDVGAFVLAVRNDAGTPLAGDGDYIPLTTDATGALRVNATFTGDITVALDCATDSVTICPGVDPIIVSGTVSVNEPITVDAVDFDIRNLSCLTDSVAICPGLDPIVVVGTDLDIRPLDCLTDSITVCQGTDPWIVSGTVELGATTLAALETITVNQGTSPWVVSGTISVTEPVTVDAVDLDIRNLDCLTDSVTVCPGVDPLPVSGTISTFEASLVPKGYQQIVSPIVSTALTVPAGAIYALMQARTSDISYRDDGVAPTNLAGMRIVIDNSLFYTGSLAAVRVISVVGGILDILYYGVI